MNLTRTLVIAANVFRETIRDRVLYLVGFFALALLAIATLLPEISAGTEQKIILDVGLAGISLLGLLIAVFVGAGLINKEIEKRTVFTLIAKPISRSELIVGKHWGLSALLTVMVTAMMLVYFLTLSIQHVPFPADSLILAAVFQCLELSLMAAVALMFSVLTSSLLATLLSLAVYCMGHFSRELVSLGNLAKSDGLRQVTETLYVLLPDLARLDLKNQAVYGLGLLPQPVELVNNALYGGVYITVLLAIASLIFSRREF